MTTVTQTEFCNGVRKYLDAVAEGEEIEVCRDGKPIAKMSPASRAAVPSWKRDRPLIKLRDGVTASQIIIEERREGM